MRAGAVIAFVVSLQAAFAGVSCLPPNPSPPTPCPNAPATSAAPLAAASATNRAPVVAWPPVVMQCLQKGDSCGGSAATCRELASLSANARAEATHCFEVSACDAYDVCFRAFLSAHAISSSSSPPSSPSASASSSRDE